MLSRLQKLSKDMILYSVILSDFEKPDFKNDALAGVRANYFNSNHCAQSDTTEIELDGRQLSLSYSMKEGEPVSWKITKNHQPYQSVRRGSGSSYCVMTYSDNGVVHKRAYFDGNHIWQRTDYYHQEKENKLLASVYPRMSDGLLTLRVEKFSDDNTKTRLTLFPSENHGGIKCAALVYSNAGMLWYDSRFAPSSVSTENSSDRKGFCFTLADFCSEADETLDLENAAFLSGEDIESADSELTENIPEEERPYSAYDKIESILLEAQKTNKNIFGEVVSHAEPVPEEEAPEETDEAVESLEETETEEIPAVEEPAAENDTEAPEASDAPEEPEYEVAQEGESDMEIKTPNGVYSFYGQLDGNNQRTGRGRTTAPDGTPVYEGGYSLDKRSGFGVCYYKDGSPNYFGNWEEGRRNGRGVGFRQSDGTIHVGKWTENKPNGTGARFDSDGNFLDVCGYENGVRNGTGVSFDEEGRILIRQWENGELISERVISDEE